MSRGGLLSFADLTRAPRPDPAGDGEQAAALRERCRTASTGGRGRRRLAALLTANGPAKATAKPPLVDTGERFF